MFRGLKDMAISAGLLVEKPDSVEPAVNDAPVPTSPTPVHTAVQPTNASLSRPDDEMLASIMARVDKATPEVLNTFYSMVESFAEVANNDAGRFKAAYIALNKNNGVNAATLQNAMSKRVAAANDVQEEFNEQAAVEQQNIEYLRQKATALQEQVNQLTQQIQDLQSEAANAEAEVTAARFKFNATLSAVKSQLATQQSDLSTYLPADGAAKKGTTSRGRIQ